MIVFGTLWCLVMACLLWMRRPLEEQAPISPEIPPVAVLEAPPPQTLGPYRLLGVLGRGGMATVYQACDTRNERLVALKVMLPELQENEEFVGRFEREIKISRLLQHPNLIQVFDDGCSEGQRFLAMEMALGRSLYDILREGIPDLHQFASYTTQIASGLHFAHTRQLCHRDIKPANIVISPSGLVKILDFGLAIEDGQNRFTTVGYAMGTPAYMAPEVFTQGICDARSDQYSVGILCYEMLTGQVPFRGEMMEMAKAHVKQPVPLPTSLRPDLPCDWEEALLRMLRKDPGQRFENLQQAAVHFQAADCLA